VKVVVVVGGGGGWHPSFNFYNFYLEAKEENLPQGVVNLNLLLFPRLKILYKIMWPTELQIFL